MRTSEGTAPRPAAWDAEAAIARLERESAPHKTLIGPTGWLFLINDRNDVLRQQYGHRAWSAAEADAAVAMLERRRDILASLGAAYLNVSTPEKCAVYREHLPTPLCDMPIARRPVGELTARLPFVIDTTADVMVAKAEGRLFFRGDSHLNWLGSYWSYRAIHSAVARVLPSVGPAIMPDDLIREPAGYDGDLYELLPAALKSQVDRLVGDERGPCTLELTTQMRPAHPRARRVEPPARLAAFCERPTIATEIDDSRLPRAVIVRDSIAQHMIDYLAEHFSRAVFYWHQGAIFENVIAAERPDIVLHLNGERVMFDYPKLSETCRLRALP